MIAPTLFFNAWEELYEYQHRRKEPYLREAAIILAREALHTDLTHTGGLRVLLDSAPLCEVTESGGITYRNEDIDEPERINAKDKVMADFNGTVLAGVLEESPRSIFI